MVNGRLFTFGCSYTNYYWPTWADILGKSFDSHINYGADGAGNFYIFKTLIDSFAEHNINKDDTVAIMWSTVTREDRFIYGDWKLLGNIFNAAPFYDSKFHKKYCDLTLQGFYERDVPLFHAAQILLDNTKCKHYIMSVIDICASYEIVRPKNSFFSLQGSELESKYKTTLDRIIHPAVDTWLGPLNRRPYYAKWDAHPWPTDHLRWVKFIFKDYHITQETVDWVTENQRFFQEEKSKRRAKYHNINTNI